MGFFNQFNYYPKERVEELYSHIRISRDIEKYEVVDYPVEERFFKLPVQNFIEMNGIVPRPAQIPVINALNDPRYRFVVAPLARRSGKSFISYELAFLKALEPETTILVMAPSYSLASIGWNHIKKLITGYGIETDKLNQKDYEIHLSNGSMVKIGSVSRADSCVGRSYDLIVFDEADLSKDSEDAFQVSLRPTMDKPNSKAIFISTPRGRRMLWKFYNRGFADDFPRWISIHSTCYANPGMLPEDIAEAKRANSPEKFSQEYEASFDVAEGQIYSSFTVERNTADLSKMEFPWKQYESIMGIDFGYKDPDAVVYIKHNMDTDIYYIVGRYSASGTTTDVLAENIKRLLDVHGDTDVNYADSAAAQSRQDLAVLYDIGSNAAKKDVLAGIEFVHTLIASGRLVIDSSLDDVIWSIQNYFWRESENGTMRPEHDIASHYNDAIRYAVFSGVN